MNEKEEENREQVKNSSDVYDQIQQSLCFSMHSFLQFLIRWQTMHKYQPIGWVVVVTFSPVFLLIFLLAQ